MYLVYLKTAITEALQATFDSNYPDEDWRNIRVSIEYPMDAQNYPGIWINYDDTDPLEIAGINHREIVLNDSGAHEVTRWRFFGTISMTIAALSSLERDRLYDQVVRVIAFSQVEESGISEFRDIIETNDFLGINLNYDVLRPSGDAASPGTPWGSNEVIYERTLSIDVIGEFVSDPETNTLVILSQVQTQGYIEGEPAPQFPDLPTSLPNQPWSPGDWQ